MANMNEALSGERVRIGFFGVRNAGKSSVVNAVTGQALAIVSDTPGTTTDTVSKSMELLPAGPVVIVDTPGIDDAGELGEMRIRAARAAMRNCDVAVLVVDATRGLQAADEELLAEFSSRAVPCIVALNKCDLLDADCARKAVLPDGVATDALFVSAKTREGIGELKERVAALAEKRGASKRLVADLIAEGDVVVLVIPIDESAPKGRIILPQQMVIRDILDAHATAFACQPDELACVLRTLSVPPRLVITDSQVFEQVAGMVPSDIPLTSFSILMMRYKGELESSAADARVLSQLGEGVCVLISEGCTHHRQCGDIGTVKMPAWIRAYCGHEVDFSFTSGNEFPDDLSGIACVVHCGGCMLNEREMEHRMDVARQAGVPFVNYGMAIAQMHGILERAMEPFGRKA